MLNLLFFTNNQDLKRTISGKKHGLAEVDNYQDAVNILRQAFISLIVMDFNLPAIKCRALLEHAHDYYPDIPVLAISPAPLDQIDLPPNIAASYVNPAYVEDEVKQVIESEILNLSRGGKISNVSPPSFAQLLEMEGKSGVLRVFDKKNKWGGLLVFKSGILTDARFSEFRGEDAACRIMTWDETDIFIQNKEYPFKDTITSDLQSIIVKSVHMKDEQQAVPVVKQPSPEPLPTKPKASFPDMLESYMVRHIGSRGGIGQVAYDPEAEERISELKALGSLFELGELKLICADEGIEKGLHVAGPTPTTIKINPQSSLEKITLLITRFLDTI